MQVLGISLFLDPKTHGKGQGSGIPASSKVLAQLVAKGSFGPGHALTGHTIDETLSKEGNMFHPLFRGPGGEDKDGCHILRIHARQVLLCLFRREIGNNGARDAFFGHDGYKMLHAQFEEDIVVTHDKKGYLKAARDFACKVKAFPNGYSPL